MQAAHLVPEARQYTFYGRLYASHRQSAFSKRFAVQLLRTSLAQAEELTRKQQQLFQINRVRRMSASSTHGHPSVFLVGYSLIFNNATYVGLLSSPLIGPFARAPLKAW